MLGLSFKPNTDDIRDSTSLKIASILQEHNIKVNCYDPAAMANAQQYNKTLNFFDSVYDACVGVNAIIIGTEWNEFRALNFAKIKEKIKDAIIFDLRNIYISADLEKLGFLYYGIGK